MEWLSKLDWRIIVTGVIVPIVVCIIPLIANKHKKKNDNNSIIKGSNNIVIQSSNLTRNKGHKDEK